MYWRFPYTKNYTCQLFSICRYDSHDYNVDQMCELIAFIFCVLMSSLHILLALHFHFHFFFIFTHQQIANVVLFELIQTQAGSGTVFFLSLLTMLLFVLEFFFLNISGLLHKETLST